jgi:hypothetical protein
VNPLMQDRGTLCREPQPRAALQCAALCPPERPREAGGAAGAVRSCATHLAAVLVVSAPEFQQTFFANKDHRACQRPPDAPSTCAPPKIGFTGKEWHVQPERRPRRCNPPRPSTNRSIRSIFTPAWQAAAADAAKNSFRKSGSARKAGSSRKVRSFPTERMRLG